MVNHLAKAELAVRAPIADVWSALTNTTTLGLIMFGSTVETDWSIGSPIVYSGEFEGKPFVDRGVVIEVTEPTVIRVSHAATGSDETHEVKYELRELGDEATHVVLTQDHNASLEAAAHSSENWQAMLEALRREVEHPA